VERLARVNHVVLDKTGTLTVGCPSLKSVHIAAGVTQKEETQLLHDAAALEKLSGHVLALAFDEHAQNTVVEECRVLLGLGVEGRVRGQWCRVGSREFISEIVDSIPRDLLDISEREESVGATSVWMSRETRCTALFIVGDALRDDAKQAINHLQEMNLSLEILSGDRSGTCRNVAETLGISEVRGGASPEQKLARVEELQAQGKHVAMAGDGVNDAAALALADVGISAAGGAEVARDAADVFLSFSRGPSAIVEAISLSRRAMRVIRFNLAVAVAYNLIGAFLAVTGHITPLTAAILMPISSVTVLAIAARA
jgi:P-type E1-E2 ATPase